MSNSLARLLMASLFAAILVACPADDSSSNGQNDHQQHQTQGHNDGSTTERWQLTNNNGFKVTYVPQPDPIPLNVHFGLQLQVTTPDGKPLDDVEIEVDADMPEHKHGMNVKPEVTSSGNGRFAAKGFLFHMLGHWHIYVMVRRKDQPARERAIFSVNPVPDRSKRG